MSDMSSLPVVPEERLADWRQVERNVTSPFSLPILRVTAATVVYEDADLRDRIRDRLNRDGQWRFFVASRIELSPSPPGSEALFRLIASQAASNFEQTLSDRGFRSTTRRPSRSLRVRDTDARLFGFDATGTVDGVGLDVRAWAAVWPTGGRYLVAGGAYPTRVRRVSGDSAVDTDTLATFFDPDAFRAELFELIRATR